jgi:hypothetical protein
MEKKIIICLIVLLNIVLNVYSNELYFNQEFLINTSFEFSHKMATAYIRFYGNNNYEIKYASEGIYWYDEGYYKIIDNKAFLTPYGCYRSKNGQKINCNNSLGSAECYLKKDDNSLFYEYYLVCKSYNNKNLIMQYTVEIEFPVKEYKTKPGKIVSINGTKSITIGYKPGVTTENLNIREKPSVNSRKILYVFDLYEAPYEYIPKNTEISILARTNVKDNVSGIKNYWYYVLAGGTLGWVFGEYIKIIE